MPSPLQILAALMGTALALPKLGAMDDDPIRILPYSWQFNITALEGPGCPDFGSPSPTGRNTRTTFGSNTMDGSEIYYWFIAYPYFVASVGPDKPEASVWCETTLSYAELDQDLKRPAVPGYRLKLHKNGTAMLANYKLEEGVEATWKFTYYTDGDDKIVDTLKIAGPYDSGDLTASHDNSPTDGELVRWPLPECGTGTIKYRTELTVVAKKDGASGTVDSEKFTRDGVTVYYGAQQGVSYDWEKCAA